MTDQPAPDFEEARVCAEAMLMVADEPTARFGHEAVMDLSRAVLALLSEREAREELLEQRRRLLILGNYGYDTQAMVDRIDEPGFLGDEWLKEWYGEDVLDLFALPATESAQAEGEPRGALETIRANQDFIDRKLREQADRNSGHSPEEVVDG